MAVALPGEVGTDRRGRLHINVTPVTDSSLGWVPTHRSTADGSEVRRIKTFVGGEGATAQWWFLVENENGDRFPVLADEWEVIQ